MLKISLIMHRPDCKSSLGVLFGILLQPAHPKLENIEPEIEILRKTSEKITFKYLLPCLIHRNFLSAS